MARAAGASAGGQTRRDQGPARHRGPRHDVRLDPLRRPRAGTERRGGAAPGSGGLPRRRHVEPARVRVRHLVAEPALRHGAEPALPGPPRGRLEWRLRSGAALPGPPRGRLDWRLRSGDRRSRRRPRARHGLGRLDPDPRGVVRHRRLQADVRPRARRRCLPARAELRPRRPDGRDRRRLRRAAERARAELRAQGPRVTRGGSCRGRLARRGRPTRARARHRSRRALSASRVDRLPVAGEGGDLFPRTRGRLWRQHPLEARALLRGDGRRGVDGPAAAGGVPRALREPVRRPRPARHADRPARRTAGRRRRGSAPRPRHPAHVPVRLPRLAALALPCGSAEEGLPASVQLVGRPGDDARVLAAGELLASLIRGTAAAPGMPN